MKKIITLTLCFMLLCMTVVVSASSAEVTVQYEDDRLIMKVPFGTENVGVAAIGKLFRPGKTQADIAADNSNLTEVFAGVAQEVVDAEGIATFTFEVTGNSGYYTASFSTRKTVANPIEKVLPFTPSSAVTELIVDLCALEYDESEEADNSEAISVVAGLFETPENDLPGCEILGFDKTSEEYVTYEALGTQKAIIHEMLLYELTQIDCDEQAVPPVIPTQNDIFELFKKCVVVNSFLNGTDVDAAIDMLKNDADIYGVSDTECYTNLFLPKTATDASDKDKKIVEEAVSSLLLAELTVPEMCKLSDSFDESLFMAALVNNDSDGEVGALMDAVPNYLTSIGITDYATANNKADVWEAAASAKTLADFVSIVNATASEEESDDKYSGSGSHSSGGGGSKGGTKGSSGAAIITPIAEIEAFSDLETVPWAKEAILALEAADILNGREYGKFYPSDYIKREEFAKVLVSAFKLSGESEVSFKDADSSAWYYNYIIAAYANGIIKGNGDYFGIGENLTRQDMAVMIGRILESKMELPEVEESNFEDNEQISDYAKKYVACLSKLGFVSGVGDNYFEPQRPITRAEVAKVIYGVMKEVDSL